MSRKLKKDNLNKALDIFENKVGFDFYSLLTNESTKNKCYKLNQKRDFSKYIDENKNILLEIDLIETEYINNCDNN